MPFDDSLVNEIVKRADIVKVISSFINVIKKGKSYVAVCPFHDDTNPSMSISPEKRMFKCFVCGTGGNVIRFVQKYLHISFNEAMKKVAEMINFDDPRLKSTVTVKQVDTKAEPLISCLHDLTVYYQYALNTPEGKEGLQYFQDRHLDNDLLLKYKLGYAYKDGKATINFLQSKGHSLKTIEDTGIANLIGTTYSDKNQGRVIFPICNPNGDVIGYSARRLKDDGSSKYVNSPETYLFHKSEVLYNYHIAKEACKVSNCLYICEGFMDVFALSKIGYDNAVAIMGTALTAEHVKLLRRLNVELRLCLDGDLPGQTAMMKASSVLSEAGLDYVVVDNQNTSYDPDEILNNQGPEALKTYLNKTLNKVDFMLSFYKNSSPLKTMEQKKKLIVDFVPIIVNVKSQLEYDNYVRKLSIITGFEIDSIKDYMAKARAQYQTDNIIQTDLASFHPERKLLRKLEFAERELLYQMINNEEAAKFYVNNNVGFYDSVYRNIADFIIDYADKNPHFNPIDVVTALEESDLDNKDDLINQLTDICFEKNHPTICNNELLSNLLNSINEEKDKIFNNDLLTQSLEGKDPLEQARILANFNRDKLKKDLENGEKTYGKEN